MLTLNSPPPPPSSHHHYMTKHQSYYYRSARSAITRIYQKIIKYPTQDKVEAVIKLVFPLSLFVASETQNINDPLTSILPVSTWKYNWSWGFKTSNIWYNTTTNSKPITFCVSKKWHRFFCSTLRSLIFIVLIKIWITKYTSNHHRYDSDNRWKA